MAEDEDPEVAAALAKLAGQDAAAAEHARGALEWIAGDRGLALITQQRIQNFCWYDLPVKWLVDLDDKLRVVAALAQALDLLQLPRYAVICHLGGGGRGYRSACGTSAASGSRTARLAGSPRRRVRLRRPGERFELLIDIFVDGLSRRAA